MHASNINLEPQVVMHGRWNTKNASGERIPMTEQELLDLQVRRTPTIACTRAVALCKRANCVRDVNMMFTWE
jgi:hypothetical protein